MRRPAGLLLFDGSGAWMGYPAAVSTRNALKLLYELRAVLERVAESDVTLHETVGHDVDRAALLADASIAELTEEEPESDETEAGV